jgi:hypothetical protein
MKNSKKANATNKDINLPADALTDLPVAEELAGETRGGAVGQHIAVGGHVRVFDGATGDVNGDGFADIIVGAGAGAPAGHVK